MRQRSEEDEIEVILAEAFTHSNYLTGGPACNILLYQLLAIPCNSQSVAKEREEQDVVFRGPPLLLCASDDQGGTREKCDARHDRAPL